MKNLYKVVFKGTKKAMEGKAFGIKSEAKLYRDSLNKEQGYDAEKDLSGKVMPYNVTYGADHYLAK
jgi:hypothetical protein